MKTRTVMLVVIGALYLGAGVLHFRSTDALLSITPDWVPYPREVIYATGIFQFIAVAALFTKRFRKAAGIAMAAYAVCVWPANIKHAVEGIEIAHVSSSWWYHGPRLAFQPVIVWWALFSTGVIDWPWRAAPETNRG